jgi:glycosyltransferase involved in cell wall biosynthesis
MTRILVLIGHYIPAYRAGGPVRTLAAIVQRLGDDFSFCMLTKDRDLGDTHPFTGIRSDVWLGVGKAQVRYLSPPECSVLHVRRLIQSTEHDLLYLNSFFSPRFSVGPLLLRKLGAIPDKPVVIAPRGEFSPGALCLKSLKKQVYIRLAKSMGLLDDVFWQASSEGEKHDIESNILQSFTQNGGARKITIAPDLVPIQYPGQLVPRPRKDCGTLHIVFLSRISPMKNLGFAIETVHGLAGEIYLDIYGPVNDTPYERAYWLRCKEQLRSLPANIRATYHGSVAHSDVPHVFAKHDLLLLPTLGENFGHAILEAMSAGCPVLISDRTPWRNLAESYAGWDIPLERPQAFRKMLQSIVEMSESELALWRNGAQAYAQRFIADEANVERQRQLFLNALGKTPL